MIVHDCMYVHNFTQLYTVWFELKILASFAPGYDFQTRMRNFLKWVRCHFIKARLIEWKVVEMTKYQIWDLTQLFNHRLVQHVPELLLNQLSLFERSGQLARGRRRRWGCPTTPPTYLQKFVDMPSYVHTYLPKIIIIIILHIFNHDTKHNICIHNHISGQGL
jgi:hypothetical protein